MTAVSPPNVPPPSADQVAEQQNVHKAGDHHGDSERPAGGQARQGPGEVPHHLRGAAAAGPRTGLRGEDTGPAKRPAPARRSGGAAVGAKVDGAMSRERFHRFFNCW